MRKPKLRELGEAIRAIIHGPYTAKFPAEPTPLPETFRGCPRYDEETCVGCGACHQVCPPGAIEMEDDLEALGIPLANFVCKSTTMSRSGLLELIERILG